MIPAPFEYAVARSVDDAVALLQRHGDEAKLLAGGHSLLPLMKLRLATPGYLIDLGRIPNMAYIHDAGDYVAIGAMTTHHALAVSDLLRQRLPVLAEAAGMVGDMQVRNRGTIGGSLAHADPASDLPTVASALDAQLVARGANGERTIPVRNFFRDVWTSALEPDEVLTEVRIPYVHGTPLQAYEKFSQRSADWAIVGVAASLSRENGTIARAAVALTNVGTTPVRATRVEEALQGRPAAVDTVSAAAAYASDGLHPSPELKASSEYKLHLARVITRRALTRALAIS